MEKEKLSEVELLQIAEDFKLNLVWYGPHPCQRCDKEGKKGTLIVKAGNGALDELEFDFVHDSHYPHHQWKRHICSDKNRTAVRLGSMKSDLKKQSSRANGKKGGRPKKSLK